jgi:2-dehydro-3-deoxy-D-arabinonate dehydratase
VAFPSELLAEDATIDGILGDTNAPTRLADALNADSAGAVPLGVPVLAPVGRQEVWAAGVTYRRSRDARRSESHAPDSYDRVYEADRPELFLKASPGRTVGPGSPVGVRADSGWDVPEPELAVVVDRVGRIVAYTIGNDLSSRSIEGENPLYLPQAKSYNKSCSIGPCLVAVEDAPPLDELVITLDVNRQGTVVYTDQVAIADMKRTPEELVGWLYLAQDFPHGSVLLTGTAIVPSDEFSLMPGDEVRIAVNGLGELVNPVEKVGNDRPRFR